MPLVTFQTHSFTARIFELSLIYVGQMYKINIKAVHKVAFFQCTRPLIKKLFLLYFRSKRYSPAQFRSSNHTPSFYTLSVIIFLGTSLKKETRVRAHTRAHNLLNPMDQKMASERCNSPIWEQNMHAL